MNREISVIVPVFNVEQFLERSILALINQTIFQQLEILLIDDGSTDNSFQICKMYSERYENIVFIHQENKGVSSARNAGLQRATGRYLAFLDADDYLEKDMYELLLTNILLQKADMSIVDFFVCFEDGQKIKKRGAQLKKTWTRDEAVADFLSGKYIGGNVFDKLILREKVKDVFFKEGKAIGEDMYYIFEVLMKLDLVAGDFQGKYYYEQREGSAMKSTFSEKYFDTLFFSELIVEEVKRKMPVMLEKAEAHLVHEECKTVERMYLYDCNVNYLQQRQVLLAKLQKYSVLNAFKFLSKRQALGLFLMKLSPWFYIKILKIMKIE